MLCSECFFFYQVLLLVRKETRVVFWMLILLSECSECSECKCRRRKWCYFRIFSHSFK